VGPYGIKKELGFGKFLVSINDLDREVDKDDLVKWVRQDGKAKAFGEKGATSYRNLSATDRALELSPPLKSSLMPTRHQPQNKVIIPPSPKKINSKVDLKILSPFIKAKKRSPDPLVGKRIEVWWEGEKKWYPGVIDRVSDNLEKGTHEVLYDDEKDKEDPNIYEFLKGKNKAKYRLLEDDGLKERGCGTDSETLTK